VASPTWRQWISMEAPFHTFFLKLLNSMVEGHVKVTIGTQA
jgi:hypothetical protein